MICSLWEGWVFFLVLVGGGGGWGDVCGDTTEKENEKRDIYPTQAGKEPFTKRARRSDRMEVTKGLQGTSRESRGQPNSCKIAISLDKAEQARGQQINECLHKCRKSPKGQKAKCWISFLLSHSKIKEVKCFWTTRQAASLRAKGSAWKGRQVQMIFADNTRESFPRRLMERGIKLTLSQKTDGKRHQK